MSMDYIEIEVYKSNLHSLAHPFSLHKKIKECLKLICVCNLKFIFIHVKTYMYFLKIHQLFKFFNSMNLTKMHVPIS